ncbi:MAG: tRNA lysidine(34) synthetase TilS [Bacteroidales bacterium]
MISRFQKNILEQGLLRPTEKVLVAVSGGLDSMCLLHLLYKSGYSLAVAHCNFLLRADESDADEAFVKSFCIQHNLPVFCKQFDAKKYAQQQGISIQESARNLRYEWFEQLANEQLFDKIAVAHTLSDSVETFFINLTRGTGLRGLRGIASKYGKVVRPLLFTTRTELEQYAKQQKISSRNDASNDDVKYRRNFMRHRIIPQLKSQNPSFEATMRSNMQRIAISEMLLQEDVEKLKKEACVYHPDSLNIYIEKLPKKNRHFWLYELLNVYGFSESVLQDLEVCLKGESGKQFFSTSHTLLKDRDMIIVQKTHQKDIVSELYIENFRQLSNASRKIKYRENILQLQMIPYQEVNFVGVKKNVAFIDYDKLKFPLCLRIWTPGDLFTPQGMQKKKKVSDFLINAKVNLFDKKKQCVLLNAENHIVWLVGHRIDETFAIRQNTLHCLRLEWIIRDNSL